jgi:surface polysaccharide O-acyltransferase-like enzyme
MSMMFEAGPNVGRRTSILRLALRLLLPWLIWAAIYAVFNVVRNQPIIDTSHGLILGVLASPSIHLWYLPFVFVAMALFGLLKGRTSMSLMAVSATAVACGLIVTIPTWRPASLAAGYPLAQLAHACTPILIGIVAGCGMRARWPWGLMIPVVGLLVIACFRPFPTVAPIYLLGLGLVAAVLALPLSIRQRAPQAKMLFGAMLGVYLVHPLALAILHPIIERSEVAGVALAFMASTLGVIIAQWVAPWPLSLILGTPMPADQTRTLFRSRAMRA